MSEDILHKLIELYNVGDNAKLKIRYLIVIHFLKQKSIDDISNFLMVSKDTIYYWIRRFKKEGIEGLKTRKKSGRPKKIKQNKLLALLAKSPRTFGYENEHWKINQLQEILVDKYDLSPQYVYELLRELNWKPIKEDIGVKQFILPKTKSGLKITEDNLRMMAEMQWKLDAALFEMITGEGLLPKMKIIRADKKIRILEGKTSKGTLTVRYEEFS